MIRRLVTFAATVLMVLAIFGGYIRGPIVLAAADPQLIGHAAGACAPGSDMRQALMNAGYQPIWSGISDAGDGTLPTTLWETPARAWVVTTADDRGDCIVDVGYESLRR